MAKVRISYNAPVVLTFALLAVVVCILPLDLRLRWFAAHPQILGTESYVGLFSHVLGHKDWTHLMGNFMLILLLGPLLEERYGSRQLLVMILITALVTGLINLAISDTMIIGASGIVFMMILLASMANIRRGEVPLTFIAVAVIYLGRELVNAFDSDDISQLGHLVGGVVGAAFGFALARGKAAAIEPARAKAVPPAGAKALR